MTRKLTHTLYALVAASAIAAIPAMSAAEGDKQQGQQQGQAQQEGKKEQGQAQHEGKKEQGQARQGQQQSAKRLSLDESMTLPLANGCSYNATINGTVSPVKGEKQQGQQGQPQAQQGQQHVNADLRVTASVICPNQATLTVSENVTRTGAITRDALEEAIERRGTIFTGQPDRHCAFVPDFELTAEKLEGIGVAYMCASQSGQQGQQQQRQGG